MGSGLLRPDSEFAPIEPSRVPAPPPPPYGYVPQSASTFSLADYWRILVKRKWTVLAVLVTLATLTLIATLRMTPIYEAVARINIGTANSDFLGFKDNQNSNRESDDYMVALETQVRILESDSLALQVIKKLKLDQKPQFGGAAPAAVKGASSSPALDSGRESSLLSTFHSNLRILSLPNTRVLELRYTSPDPALAAEIVNTLVNTYTEQNIKTKFESTMQAADWLSKQLADLQIKVETSQQNLVKYQREHEILGGDEKSNIITGKLEDVNKELSAAEADRIQKQALYQMSVTPNSEGALPAGEGSLLNRLRSEEADLKDQYAQASVQFGPNYTKVLEIKSRLAQIQEGIASESKKAQGKLQSDYLTAQRREKMLKAAFENQKAQANELNKNAIEYNLLKREAESNRQIYEGLLQKLKEAGISAGLNSSNVRIVDQARVPTSPSKPDLMRNMEIGILMGLVSGIALAFAFEAMDNTIRTAEQAEVISGLPSLGMIPMAATMASAAKGSRLLLGGTKNPSQASNSNSIELVPHSRPRSELAEAYRALRTSMLLSSAGAPPKVVLITSALPQEGKTTTTLNAAVVLAQQGRRVLLVDADLRRPSIHKAFKIKPEGGLSEVLTGRQKPEAFILATHLPNLFILPAGSHPPHPAELLASPMMRSLIAEWREQYDHIIIDSPPVLTVTDAVLLSVEVDRVMLVVRSGQTTKAALRRSRDLLAQVGARVMGVVINALDLRSPDHYHQYYSGSKYYGGYYHE